MLKFFFWIRLFENLLLAKYLISAVATLNRILVNLILVFFTFDRRTRKIIEIDFPFDVFIINPS